MNIGQRLRRIIRRIALRPAVDDMIDRRRKSYANDHSKLSEGDRR